MTPGSRHTAAKSTQHLLLDRLVNFLVFTILYKFDDKSPQNKNGSKQERDSEEEKEHLAVKKNNKKPSISVRWLCSRQIYVIWVFVSTDFFSTSLESHSLFCSGGNWSHVTGAGWHLGGEGGGGGGLQEGKKRGKGCFVHPIFISPVSCTIKQNKLHVA